MSRDVMERLLGKAVLDSEFREVLFADPDQVLGGYDLTEEEAAALKAIDYETMESFAARVAEQMSKAGLIGLTGAVAGITGGAEPIGQRRGSRP